MKLRWIMICGATLIIVAGVANLVWDKVTLSSPRRIAKETGLILPKGFSILATKMNTLSLCDGPNYGWLVSSTTDMTLWIEANMHMEDGWKNIKTFSEVAPLASGQVRELRLDSVWESDKTMPDGRTEEAFLYVAEGRTVAMLTTFRP